MSFWAVFGVIGKEVVSKNKVKHKNKVEPPKVSERFVLKQNSSSINSKMQEMITEAGSLLTEFEEFEAWYVALFAIAISLANCDGEFHPLEKKGIDKCVEGVVEMGFPDSLINNINELYKTPPTFNEAMKYIRKVDKELWGHFDFILGLVANSDGVIRKEESAFLEAWNQCSKI